MKRPAAKWWRTLDWVVGCGAAGLLLGLIIQQMAGGRGNLILGIGAAGAVTGLMAASGANFDAGWRGVALSLAAAILTFLVVGTLIG